MSIVNISRDFQAVDEVWDRFDKILHCLRDALQPLTKSELEAYQQEGIELGAKVAEVSAWDGCIYSPLSYV